MPLSGRPGWGALAEAEKQGLARQDKLACTLMYERNMNHKQTEM